VSHAHNPTTDELFSLIIVDDEQSVRVGLADLIDWAELGFTLEGAFDDGDKAIEFLSARSIDAVLTDIVMARTSGLDVASHIQQNSPSTVTIILSGHRDFAELRAVFRQVYHELHERRRVEAQSAVGYHRLKRLVVAARQHLLEEMRRMSNPIGRDWLLGKLPGAELGVAVADSAVVTASIPLQKGACAEAEDEAIRISVYLSEPSDDLIPVPLVRRDEIEIVCLSDSGDTPDELEVRVRDLLSDRIKTLASFGGQSMQIDTVSSYANIFLWAADSIERAGGSPLDAHPAVAKSLKVIDELLESGATIERVAEAVDVSPSHLSHIFRASLGVTFSHYLRERRVERGKKYLLETELTVEDISERIGYTSAKHFYPVFRELTGTTPAAFRASRRTEMS